MASKGEGGKGGFWGLAAKRCDTCKGSPALLFCRADSAFLCGACDSRVHGANRLASRHERVWVCEVCEQAPASVTCKADAAALCAACDADIHSANPLARRHERVPVVPFLDPPASALKPSAAAAAAAAAAADGGGFLFKTDDCDDEENEAKAGAGAGAEAAAWLLPNPKVMMGEPELKSAADYYFPDVDPYLDLEYASSMDATFNSHSDSVVPVQPKAGGGGGPPPPMLASDCIVELDFTKPSYSSYTTHSLSHSVSSSEVGVVPDGSVGAAMADVTNPYGGGGGGRAAGMDREARVMRYREKRKNRRFEKTIRYASRKAYAETRPRIKGRFAKRTEIEADVDLMYTASSALMVDTGYGVVPTF